MLTEKEKRAIGFKVVQYVGSSKKRLFSKAVEGRYYGYEIHMWNGNDWLPLPVEKRPYAHG